jgi:hypothetical protein
MRTTLVLGKFITTRAALVTGTTSGQLTDVETAWSSGVLSATGSWRYNLGCKRITALFGALPIDAYAPIVGIDIGNGSTATTATWDKKAVSFRGAPEVTKDANSGFRDQSAAILASGSRLLYVNQSASDVVTINDCVLSSTGDWGVSVGGSASGTCAFNRTQFWYYDSFTAGHADYTDCFFEYGTAAVSVAATTGMARCTVRNGVGHGIELTGAAGDYSALDVTFDNNSTYDVELGSGGAGTYVLTGIAVTGAYTLKIRNTSATNAVVVELAAGITYSTSTAGGAITVTAPSIYQSVTVSNLVAGSRVQIYDTTSSTELSNTTPAGTSVTWTDSVAASASRAIRVRITNVSGATAYEMIEANIGTCGTSEPSNAVSYLANQTLDTSYNDNAIDGSAVTGIAIDDTTNLVKIAVAGGGSRSWPQIYAYQVYWLNTESGIRDDFAFIESPDIANYRLTGFQIRNDDAAPLILTDGYGVDATTGEYIDVIDTAGSVGNIFPSVAHVVSKVVTVSGVNVITGDIADIPAAPSAATVSAQVWADVPATLDANMVQVRGQTLDGSGSEADPWGPA